MLCSKNLFANVETTPTRASFSRPILKQRQSNTRNAQVLIKPILDLDISAPHIKVVRFSPAHTTYETHSPDVYNRDPHEVVLDPNVILKLDGRLCDERSNRKQIPRLRRARLTRHIEEARPNSLPSPSPRQRIKVSVQNAITEEEESEDAEDSMLLDPIPAPIFTAISEEDELEESNVSDYSLTEMENTPPSWKPLCTISRLDAKQRLQLRREFNVGPQWSPLAHRRSIRTEWYVDP